MLHFRVCDKHHCPRDISTGFEFKPSNQTVDFSIDQAATVDGIPPFSVDQHFNRFDRTLRTSRCLGQRHKKPRFSAEGCCHHKKNKQQKDDIDQRCKIECRQLSSSLPELHDPPLLISTVLSLCKASTSFSDSCSRPNTSASTLRKKNRCAV